MEKTFAKVDEMATHVKAYLNNRINTVKLNAAEKGSKLIADAISLAIVLMILALFIVFASIALAFALGKWTGELYWGFLIVSGIYLLLGLLVWMRREKILRLPILNSMLKQLFKEDDEKNQQHQGIEV